MPRPKRPERKPISRVLRLQAEEAGLDSHEHKAEFRHLMTDVDRLVRDYDAGWTPGTSAGRRRETRRNRLIADIARLFHEQSAWTSADADDLYLSSLKGFLIAALAGRDVLNVPWSNILRHVPAAFRRPRSA